MGCSPGGLDFRGSFMGFLPEPRGLVRSLCTSATTVTECTSAVFSYWWTRVRSEDFRSTSPSFSAYNGSALAPAKNASAPFLLSAVLPVDFCCAFVVDFGEVFADCFGFLRKKQRNTNIYLSDYLKSRTTAVISPSRYKCPKFSVTLGLNLFKLGNVPTHFCDILGN